MRSGEGEGKRQKMPGERGQKTLGAGVRGELAEKAGGERVLLMAPERRRLLVELEEPYDRRDLEVLLKAFRKRLVDGGGKQGSAMMEPVDRIVGPGFVIEMLGGRRAVRSKKDKNRS
jgi:hypothetical protein